MKFALTIYEPASTVPQSTWRFDADNDEKAIAIAAIILGRFGWDSAALATSTGRRVMIVATGIAPMESHK